MTQTVTLSRVPETAADQSVVSGSEREAKRQEYTAKAEQQQVTAEEAKKSCLHVSLKEEVRSEGTYWIEAFSQTTSADRPVS